MKRRTRKKNRHRLVGIFKQAFLRRMQIEAKFNKVDLKQFLTKESVKPTDEKYEWDIK